MSGAEAQRPGWLTAGREAVLLQPTDRGALRAETVTIERVLKRDVVLSNGSRFRVDRLQNSTGAWGTTTYLVAPDDPRVAETRARIRQANAKSRALGAVESYRRSALGARQVAELWTRLADVEDAEQP